MARRARKLHTPVKVWERVISTVFFFPRQILLVVAQYQALCLGAAEGREEKWWCLLTALLGPETDRWR